MDHGRVAVLLAVKAEYRGIQVRRAAGEVCKDLVEIRRLDDQQAPGLEDPAPAHKRRLKVPQVKVFDNVICEDLVDRVLVEFLMQQPDVRLQVRLANDVDVRVSRQLMAAAADV